MTLGSRRLRFLLTMPKLGIGLLMISVVALLWVLQRTEYEEQRQTLIADALWLEQNMRFQLTNSREKIQQIAGTLPASVNPKGDFLNAARALLKQHSEIEQILWLDTREKVNLALPNATYPRADLSQFGDSPLSDLIDKARRLGKPVYSQMYLGPGHEQQFEVFVPVFDDGHFDGTLLTVFSLNKLLEEAVPWWFAQKYQLQVIDDENNELAAKSKVSGKPYVSYDLPVEGFHTRLLLRVSAARPPYNPTQRFFVGAIIVLAFVVLLSLWAIRRQLHKRLEVEQALRESHAFRKAMEDSLITGLRARDLDGRLIYVNPAFCQMVGFPADELLGRAAPMPYWSADQMDETFRLHQAVMHGQAPREGYEVRLKRRDGEPFDALIYEAPLIDGEGRHVGWMGSVLDVTERRRNEDFHRQQQERLQHTARLVTMGEMASTLAHELNQPLSAIASYATGCQNKIEAGTLKPGEIAEVVGKISNQSQRAGRIIKQVQDFIRKREPKREACAMAEVVDEAFALFEPQARTQQVRIGRQIQGGLPEVLADSTMLEQVMINLLRNAAEAMADLAPSERIIQVNVSRDLDHIIVRVADRGPGISAAQAEKLFMPFYTTKAEGMGMGLPICRSIIEFHRGRLTLENNADGGATFVFTLPIGCHETDCLSD